MNQCVGSGRRGPPPPRRCRGRHCSRACSCLLPSVDTACDGSGRGSSKRRTGFARQFGLRSSRNRVGDLVVSVQGGGSDPLSQPGTGGRSLCVNRLLLSLREKTNRSIAGWARSRYFDRSSRSQHTALFERARGRGSSQPRKNGGARSGGSVGLGYLVAGRSLHSICPRSVQGEWELEGDNRRFSPRRRGGHSPGHSPAPTMGGHPRGGGVLPRESRVVGLFKPDSPARHSAAPSLLGLFEVRPRSPRPHRQLIVVRASRLHGAGLEGEERSDGPLCRPEAYTTREILSPHPSLRWLRSEANPLPRSAPDIAVGARNGIHPLPESTRR